MDTRLKGTAQATRKNLFFKVNRTSFLLIVGLILPLGFSCGKLGNKIKNDQNLKEDTGNCLKISSSGSKIEVGINSEKPGFNGELAQSLKFDKKRTIEAIYILIKTKGEPKKNGVDGKISLTLEGNAKSGNNDLPDPNTVLRTAEFDYASQEVFPTGSAYIKFTFSETFLAAKDVKYWLRVKGNYDADKSNHALWMSLSGDVYKDGDAVQKNINGQFETLDFADSDFIFKVDCAKE